MKTDERKRNLILHEPNIYKGLLILAIPLMVNNFIKTIHDVIDMYFVSNIPGYSAEAINSISITFPVVFAFLSLGIGLSAAGTALISQQIGSGQHDEAKKYASQLVVIALIAGFVLNIFSYFGAPLIMQLMGASGYALENSIKYLQIRSFELPVVFLFFAFTAIRQSSGDTITPVIYGVITIIVNIILTPLLVSYFSLGVSGAAYATLIANIIIMPMGLIQLFKAKSGITIERRYLKLDPVINRLIIKTAIPASLGQAFTAIGFGVMNGIIYSYGDPTFAAFSVGNRLSSLILHPVMAIGGVLAAFIGQNIGNQNIPRAKETFKKAMILSVGLMVIGSAALMNFRTLFTEFFIKDDLVALSLANEYMFYLFLGLPLMAIFQTFLGTFNGTGNTKFTFIISTTRLWLIRVPIVFLFKYLTDVGSAGIWYAMLMSNILIVFLGIYLYKKIDFQPKINILKPSRKLSSMST
ncbi:MAG: MATE family efflux transporter [Acholeplasmataceae bacterium]|nr:MATE family efflux transporter [Acholeplasmataceae bacterium]